MIIPDSTLRINSRTILIKHAWLIITFPGTPVAPVAVSVCPVRPDKHTLSVNIRQTDPEVVKSSEAVEQLFPDERVELFVLDDRQGPASSLTVLVGFPESPISHDEPVAHAIEVLEGSGTS